MPLCSSVVNSGLRPDPGFPGGSVGKESTCNEGDLGSILGLGRSPGGGHGNPLEYSCPENPMDRGTWWAAVHRVAKSQNMPCNCSDSIFILAFSLPGLISPTPSCLPCISSALDSSRSSFMKTFLLPGRVGPFSFLFQ